MVTLAAASPTLEGQVAETFDITEDGGDGAQDRTPAGVSQFADWHSRMCSE